MALKYFLLRGSQTYTQGDEEDGRVFTKKVDIFFGLEVSIVSEPDED